MSKLRITVNRSCPDCFSTHRGCVNIDKSNYTDVAAITLSVNDVERGKLDEIDATGHGIPVSIATENEERVPTEYLSCISGIFEHYESRKELYGYQPETTTSHYETQLRPSFSHALVNYVSQGSSVFDCPGHQGGEFPRHHPVNNQFVGYLGEMFFRFDLCNADVTMGSLLIHEGAPCIVQQHTTEVSNADKVYFVLDGTSSSNKVVLDALLAPGDLVLFDRNNHKSNHHGALLQAGATPVYLEVARDPYGFIGGIDTHHFEESYLRELIIGATPQRVKGAYPFRLAAVQLGTYDGTIYDARQVVDKVGHLCGHILLDSVRVGYEQFIPMMADCSPLLPEFNENDPGILVMQSMCEQRAGFSQAPQVHKKDSHTER